MSYLPSAFLVQRLSSKAQLPTRGSVLAAGYDLYAFVFSSSPLCWFADASKSRRAEDKIIPGRGKGLVNTELSIAVPEGTYGRIAPRSGLGSFQASLRAR